MPHFFINSNQIEDNTVNICDSENYRHIARSLRAKTGENLLLIDEKGIQYETTISKISFDCVCAKIEKSYPSKRFLEFDLYLAQSPLRSDAQNLLIEKATELGAKGIYPILTDNCALNQSVIEKKIPKWNKIMYEASKQCERAFVPECFNLISIDELLNSGKFDRIFVFCERIADKTIRKAFLEKPVSAGEKVLVIIGAEGGFSQREFEYFQENKLEMLTLGNLILKAETAVVVALGNIIYEYSNFKK